jgi:hypothetical protein
MQRMNVATWADFKTLVALKKIPIQYQESSTLYELFAPEAGIFMWELALLKGTADSDDFVTNFKAAANGAIEIKGALGRPVRMAASAQPSNTVENWKGFIHTSDAGEGSFTLDIGFTPLVYLRGGVIISPDAVIGDSLSASGVLKASPGTVVLPLLLDSIPVIPNEKINFLSAESMALDPAVMLRATYTKVDTTSRKLVAIMDFFK